MFIGRVEVQPGQSYQYSGLLRIYREKEDILNKYEYNPLTDKFKIDQINTTDDSVSAKAFVKALDFKAIAPALIIKPIVNPFKIENGIEPRDIENLHKCALVGDSIGGSVRASVWDSVRASVWDSVRASIGESVWESVGASVWASVGDSVGAYISSFFGITYRYDFTPYIDLWERGFVPSFDGKVWRLHGKSGVVYTTEETN